MFFEILIKKKNNWNHKTGKFEVQNDLTIFPTTKWLDFNLDLCHTYSSPASFRQIIDVICFLPEDCSCVTLSEKGRSRVKLVEPSAVFSKNYGSLRLGRQVLSTFIRLSSWFHTSRSKVRRPCSSNATVLLTWIRVQMKWGSWTPHSVGVPRNNKIWLRWIISTHSMELNKAFW